MQSCSPSATLIIDRKRYFLTEQNNSNNNLCFAESLTGHTEVRDLVCTYLNLCKIIGWSVHRKVILIEISLPEDPLHVISWGWDIFKENNHHQSPKTSFLLSHDQNYHRVS